MKTLKMMLAVTVALGVSVAVADKLSDFKDAVDAANSGKGCESIPYSDIRSSCQSQGSQVHDWCDGGKGPVTCGSEAISRQVKANVEKEERELKELREKKSRLETDKSRASTDEDKAKLANEISQVERQISDGEKAVEQAKRDFETRKKLVDDAVYTLDQCIAYRRAVMNSFAGALDKVRNENETPEIAELARKLRDKYEASKSGHEEQITARTNAYNTCKDSRL